MSVLKGKDTTSMQHLKQLTKKEKDPEIKICFLLPHPIHTSTLSLILTHTISPILNPYVEQKVRSQSLEELALISSMKQEISGK
jgi:aromatic ring-opening dioxygenase LigB subunit